MEGMLVEKLVNQQIYSFELNYELGIDLSLSSSPKIRAQVTEVRPFLNAKGLSVSGIITEDIQIVEEGRVNSFQQDYYFTYLLNVLEVREMNFLDYEISLQIKKINYHLIKKNGQVFLRQQLEMELKLAQYTIEELDKFVLGGMCKHTGLFLKKINHLEESFLKVYPQELPPDFHSLVKISGQVYYTEIDMTVDGCFLNIHSKFVGEYLTEDQRLGTFFFEKEEYCFIPIMGVEDSNVHTQVELSEVFFEQGKDLVVLYHTKLEFFKKQKVDYYLNPPDCPDGVSLLAEVEQLSQPMKMSNLYQEKLNLEAYEIARVIEVTGVLRDLKIEELSNQVLINGRLEFTYRYIDRDGVERTLNGEKLIEEMLQIDNYSHQAKGFWQVESLLRIPTWEIEAGFLHFEVIIDYLLFFHYLDFARVLIDFTHGEVKRERVYLTIERNAGQYSFHGTEMVYLHRYAEKLLRVDTKLIDWQSRRVIDGWLVRGEGEVTIYYLTREGELHHSQRFSFYHYLPVQSRHNYQISLQPEIVTLDTFLLEEGSLVRSEYLIKYPYKLLENREEYIVTEINWRSASQYRSILKMDSRHEQLKYQLAVDGEWGADDLESLTVQLIEYQFTGTKCRGRFQVEMRFTSHKGESGVESSVVPFVISLLTETEDDIWSEGKLRAIPVLKNYEYILCPKLSGDTFCQLYLNIDLEVRYRIVGTFPSISEE